jgi:hypothetical protein
MGKQSRRKLASKQLHLYRLHCECVRRNTEYKEQYKNLKEHQGRSELQGWMLASAWGILHGDELPDPNARPSLEDALQKPLAPGIGSPPSPADLVEDPQVRKAMEAFGFKLTDMKLDYSKLAGMLILAYFPEEKPERHSYTVFNLRWTKRDLRESFESWLDATLRERAQSGLKQQLPKRRVRLDDYVNYLKAYDLRMKNMTFRAIEKRLWPNLEDMGKKGRQYFLKGEHLVRTPPLVPQRRQKMGKA